MRRVRHRKSRGRTVSGRPRRESACKGRPDAPPTPARKSTVRTICRIESSTMSTADTTTEANAETGSSVSVSPVAVRAELRTCGIESTPRRSSDSCSGPFRSRQTCEQGAFLRSDRRCHTNGVVDLTTLQGEPVPPNRSQIASTSVRATRSGIPPSENRRTPATPFPRALEWPERISVPAAACR